MPAGGGHAAALRPGRGVDAGAAVFPGGFGWGAAGTPAGRWRHGAGFAGELLGLVALFLLEHAAADSVPRQAAGAGLALGVLLLLMGRRGWLLLGVGLALG